MYSKLIFIEAEKEAREMRGNAEVCNREAIGLRLRKDCILQ